MKEIKELYLIDVSQMWMSGVSPFTMENTETFLEESPSTSQPYVTVTYSEYPHTKTVNVSNTKHFESIISVKKVLNSCVAIFGGGADIHPSYYDHPNIHTHAGKEPSNRDIYEAQVMLRCFKEGIPIIGICRGAQLLTALSGGTLIQHVNGHHQEHDIIDLETNKIVVATSVHHQMCNPLRVPHEVWATALPNRSSVYVSHDTIPDDFKEPEVIFYPETKGLAIQGHPEFTAWASPYSKYCRSLFLRMMRRV